MGYRMKGSPAKLGTITGTSGHTSALKKASAAKVAGDYLLSEEQLESGEWKDKEIMVSEADRKKVANALTIINDPKNLDADGNLTAKGEKWVKWLETNYPGVYETKTTGITQAAEQIEGYKGVGGYAAESAGEIPVGADVSAGQKSEMAKRAITFANQEEALVQIQKFPQDYINQYETILKEKPNLITDQMRQNVKLARQRLRDKQVEEKK